MHKWFLIALLAFNVAACNSAVATPTLIPTPGAGDAPATINVGLANSEQVVGANRFAVGIVIN